MKRQPKSTEQNFVQRIFGSISTKLSLILLIAIVFVFSVTGFLIYSFTQSLLVTKIEENLMTKSTAISDEVDSMFSEKAAIVRQIAANQQMINFLTSTTSDVQSNSDFTEIMQSLDNVTQSDENIGSAWAASHQASFLLGSGNAIQTSGYDIQSRPWYEPALANQDVFFTEAYEDALSGKWC
ncbi:hypothetical protein G4V62_18710 [Bacillaceae bacterium SIJ1]|uniref:hypothetical protein n=1 Tax=Litoribacterium kuwaitense TaxID=1398745 RepID=UPI0013EB74C6|nr:hypothetical protein [Litoribacterium kuwaitense]NGP46871.1 hypothetical protein [Litoribacterium kuwaitense]